MRDPGSFSASPISPSFNPARASTSPLARSSNAAVAEWVYAGVLVAVFRSRAVDQRFRTALVAPDVAAIRRFLRTSAPIGGQWMLDMLAFASFSTLVARSDSTLGLQLDLSQVTDVQFTVYDPSVDFDFVVHGLTLY